MVKPASTSAKATATSSSSAKVHSTNTSQRSKAKANRKSTNQSSNPTKSPNKTSTDSLANSSASSSTSNVHGKDSKLAALLQQSVTNQSNKPSTSTAQNDKEKDKQTKDVKGKGKEKEKQPEIQKEKDRSAASSSSVAAARKTVFRPVLNSPFTVNWPTIPPNLSEPLLYTLIDLLSHPSLAAIRGKDGSPRDRDKGNGRRKRKLENLRKGEEREDREEREGEEWGEEILRRFKKTRLEEEEEKIEKVRDSNEAVAEKEPEGEHKELEKQKDVEMEDATREGELNSSKEPSTEKDEGTLLRDQGGNSKGGKESKERGLSRFFTIGLNSVTKKLEDQVTKASAYAITNQKTASNSSTSTSIPSITKLDLDSDPPLRMVFVCTKDIDPISMIAHFPLLTCAVNAVSEKDFSLEEQEHGSVNLASTSTSRRFPPVLLIPLPEGSSLGLSKALNLRRVSTIGLSLPLNSSSGFQSINEETFPSDLLKPLISILQKCSIEPLRANWLDIAAETSILNGNEFKLNDPKSNEEVESSNQVQKKVKSELKLRGPFIKHVRTTAPVDLRSGREKKKLARTQRKIERKEKKKLKLEEEKKELKKLKRMEVDGEEKKGKKKRVKRKKVEKVDGITSKSS